MFMVNDNNNYQLFILLVLLTGIARAVQDISYLLLFEGCVVFDIPYASHVYCTEIILHNFYKTN